MNLDTTQIFDLIAQHSYWFIFLALFLENAAFLGFVFPGVTILFLAGFLVPGGTVEVVPALACAYAGTIVGDNVNYALGRWGIHRIGWVKRLLDKNPRAIAFINNQPVWLYTFFHFPGILRPVVPLGLGSSRFSIRLWLLIDLIGALLFVSAYIAAGYLTATLSADLTSGQSAVGYIALFFTVLVILWGIRMLFIHKPWSKKTPSGPAPDSEGLTETKART